MNYIKIYLFKFYKGMHKNEDLIKSIEGDLSEMLNRVEAPVNWEEELEAKYGDDADDLMEQKYGDNWDDLFEAELMK